MISIADVDFEGICFVLSGLRYEGRIMAYHLRREDREIKDRQVMDEIIRSGRFAVCALCADNEPYVVTLSYGYDESAQCLYFHCADEGVKLEFIKKNPHACLTIIDDRGYIEKECSHAYRTVIIRGKMELLDGEAQRIEAVKKLIAHFEKNPEVQMQKVDSGSPLWQRTRMLRLVILEITGKERSRVVHK
jgi:uncharacterized protein